MQPQAPVPARKRNLGWLKATGVGLGTFVVGIAIGAAGGEASPTAEVKPAPTVTVTKPAEAAKPAPTVTTTVEKPVPGPTKTITAPPPGAQAAPPPVEKSKLSVSQENAIESAQSYIGSGDFSRKSLIEQLKYEEFSTKEATYAVDHIAVNWTAEADASAASYLETGSFSHATLMDQLLYEGFTKAQAAHGVKSVGL
jgi:hypothetical protein